MTVDLAAIEARLAAATPGPWRWCYRGDEAGYKLVLPLGEQRLEVAALPGGYDEGDADLIARAPEDLRALVAEVKRLNEALDDRHAVITGLSRAAESAERELDALREAAAAPLVHLAAGQAAVWPWDVAGRSLATVCGSTFRVYELNSHDDGFAVFDYFRGVRMANGAAPELVTARLAAIAAVVELARKGAPDAG